MDTASRSRRLMGTPAAARYLDMAESTLEKARVSGALDLPFVKPIFRSWRAVVRTSH
jgi:hypothetical protein